MIEDLASCKYLERVKLNDNPCCKKENYRENVIKLLPKLKV
jgi:hypothetical protein